MTIAALASHVNGELDLSSSDLWSNTADPLIHDGVDLTTFDQLDSSLLGGNGDVSLFNGEPTNDPSLWGETSEASPGANVDLAFLNYDPTSDLNSGGTSNDLFALNGCSSNSRVRRRDNGLCLPSDTKTPDQDTAKPVPDRVGNPLETIQQSPLFKPFLEGEDVCRKYLGGILPLAVCDSGRYTDTDPSTFRDLSDGEAFSALNNPSDYSRVIQGLSEFRDLLDSRRFTNLRNCKPGTYSPLSNTVLPFIRCQDS
jgi:hypothetical protein